MNWGVVSEKFFNSKHKSKAITFETIKTLLEGDLKNFEYKKDLGLLLGNNSLENYKFTIYSQTLAVLDKYKDRVHEIKIPKFFEDYSKLLGYELSEKKHILEATKLTFLELITLWDPKGKVQKYYSNHTKNILPVTKMSRIALFNDFVCSCLMATRSKKYLDILFKVWLNSENNPFVRSNVNVAYQFCSEKKCVVCKSKKNLKYCAECKKVMYCSREHQKEHWKLHKKTCNRYN